MPSNPHHTRTGGNPVALITDNLDIWSSAIKTKSSAGRGRGKGSGKKFELYGIKKLRELILDLAVRGLLVPQDPNDEPASVLLEKIAQEKANLIKEGKIKKQKPLPEIGGDEKPFELPKGWEVVRLGGLTSRLGSGSTPRGGKNAYVDNGVIFLRSQNVWNEGLKLDDTAYISEETHDKMGNTQVFPSDVLLNITGASLGRSTIFPEELITANVSQHVTIIRLIDKGMSHFLHLAILSPLVQKLVWGRQVGMAIEGLSKKVLEKFEFPVPPIDEQHRIVAKVDELMALCDQLEQQQSNSLSAHETLVKTLLGALVTASERSAFNDAWERIAQHFHTLFTTQNSIEQLKQTLLQLAATGTLVSFGVDVENCVLKDLLDFGPRNGFSPKTVDYETKFKVLKLGATSYGVLNTEESKFIGENIPGDSHLLLQNGDILIQRGNSASYVGSNILVANNYDRYIYPDLMMKIRANHLVDPEFLSIVLMAPSSREFMWSRMTGTSGTMPKISKKIVESIPIKVPNNLQIQRNVVSKINELMALCDTLKARLNTAQTTQLQLADSLAEQAIS